MLVSTGGLVGVEVETAGVVVVVLDVALEPTPDVVDPAEAEFLGAFEALVQPEKHRTPKPTNPVRKILHLT